MSVRVRIGNLALYGVHPADAPRVRSSLEGELGRLLVERPAIRGTEPQPAPGYSQTFVGEAEPGALGRAAARALHSRFGA